MAELKRRVWVEIDVSRLRANYAKIAAAVKPLKVLCVLKANAYGLGVMPYAAALAETDCAGFGVAEPFEALQLAGGPKPVQILSSILPDEIEPMVAAGVTQPICPTPQQAAFPSDLLRPSPNYMLKSPWLKTSSADFPDGRVGENPPACAGHMDWIPGPGGSNMPQSN